MKEQYEVHSDYGCALFSTEQDAVNATLFLAALQKTRALHGLRELRYGPREVTAVFASGNKRLINVEADSGIAMVRDIVAHL